MICSNIITVFSRFGEMREKTNLTMNFYKSKIGGKIDAEKNQ